METCEVAQEIETKWGKKWEELHEDLKKVAEQGFTPPRTVTVMRTLHEEQRIEQSAHLVGCPVCQRNNEKLAMSIETLNSG